MDFKKRLQDTHKIMSPEEMKKILGGESEGKGGCSDSTPPTCDGYCSPIFTGRETIQRTCRKISVTSPITRGSGFEYCSCEA